MYISYYFMLTSGINPTPGSRSYSELVDTWADSVYIHQLILKPHSKAARIIIGGLLQLVPVNACQVTTILFKSSEHW